MNYEIIETHLIFENGIIQKVAVLWKNGEDIKATYSHRGQTAGYYKLKDYDLPTLSLFERIAGGGMYLSEEQKKQYFPNQKFN